MANNNNEGVDNSLDSPRDSGLEKSFVGKFVSGIFNSTPLSKWFGKESTSKSTVRRREDDEDEEYDPSYVFQPPTKRAKLPSDPQHNNYSGAHLFESPVTVHVASNNTNNVPAKVYGKFPEPVAGPSGVKSRKLFEKQNTASTNTISANSFENQEVVNGDNDSDSEDSTSGYSSVARLVSKQKSEDTSNREPEKITPKAKSLFTSTDDSNERTLFPQRSQQMNTSLSSRRPAFNASTFGSPNFVDRTLSTKRIMSSPFYSGHTIYGGASAYGRKFGKSTEDLNSTRLSVQIKPVNEKPTNENATLSKTARRILSTLEQYSTPISDAKKIPVTPRKQGLLSQHVGATPYLVRDRKRPSNKELQVPSVPDLLQMKQKQRLQNSTENVRKIATKSKSTLNDKEEYKLPTEEDNKQKHNNKMKSSVASVRQKSQPVEPVSEVKLPKVSLPITTLPKFDFVMMPPPNTSDTKKSQNESSKSPITTKSPVSTTVKPTPVMEKRTVENGKTSNYTFSEPLVILKESKAIKAINCFKFSEPLCKKQSTEDRSLTFKSGDKDVKSVSFKMKNNGENTNSVGIAKPVNQLLTGSVMDVLRRKNETPARLDKPKTTETWECPTCLVINASGKLICSACDEPKPETQFNKNKGFGDQFKMSSDKWECNSCMVRNNNSDKKCIACASSKPGEDKPTVQSSFGDKFKAPVDTWECDCCLIRNKNELDCCAACGTTKSITKPVVSGFGDKFKPPSDTWECSTCMIRNKQELDKCEACETPKPGAPAQKSINTSFLGNSVKSDQKICTSTSNITFTFGIKPEWECKTCMIKNKNELTKCAACEMPKESSESDKKGFGDAFKMKGGEWECTSCLVKNKSTADTCVCCGVAKAGSSSKKLSEITKSEEKKPVISFNFGIDKSPSTQFQFGIPTTKSEVKETTTVSAPPALVFGDAAKSSTVTSSFTFGINTQEKDAPVKSVAATESVTPTIVSSNPLLKPSEKLPEKAAPAGAGFKFGLDNPLSKSQVSSEGAVTSTSKTEAPVPPALSTSFTAKPAPMFQFKPPAINGDINKPLLFGSEANKSNSTVFGNDMNKSKETVFGTEMKKPQDSPLFGSGNKLKDSPFGNVSDANKPKETLFGNATDTSKPQAPMFGTVDASKPQGALFGTVTDANKQPQGALFGNVNDTNQPQDTLFGGDANKPKDALFGSKPTESTTVFSNTPPPTFNFNPKPIESAPAPAFPPPATTSQPAGSGIFKFGANASQNSGSVKRTLDDGAENNVNNGFGSVPKIPAFGAPQGFGSTKSKPFAFGSAEAAPKTTGFNFGQADKPNVANPSFNFGSSAPSASGSSGFSFSVPNTGFNFGATAKVENQPFNPPGNVFGAGGAGAKNGSFNFGTNPNNNNQKAVFSFGANQTNPPPSQPSFPTQNQPGFNFGGPAPLNTPAAGFNFTGAPPSFNFTDGNSAMTQPQRKIKKAFRRTHR
jgi:nuclear pore complex protein Nup153